MAGFSAASNEHLIRSNLWSSQIKEVLEDELFAMKYVDIVTDFPDGDTLNIPSIGQAEVNDYAEGQAIRYTAMDTGNFTFTINEYKSSATYVYDKMKQDSFYMNRVVSEFVPNPDVTAPVMEWYRNHPELQQQQKALQQIFRLSLTTLAQAQQSQGSPSAQAIPTAGQ